MEVLPNYCASVLSWQLIINSSFELAGMRSVNRHMNFISSQVQMRAAGCVKMQKYGVPNARFLFQYFPMLW